VAAGPVAARRPFSLLVSRAAFETGLILLGLAALLVLLPHHVFSDGALREATLTQLLAHGRLSRERYSLIGPLFSAPLWLVGQWLRLKHNGLGLYNWCVFALGLGALWLLLRRWVDHGVIRAFFLILIAASMFPNHLTNYYGEVFTAVLVGAGIVAVVSGPAVAGWVAVALGVANTPATALALAGVVAERVWRARRLRQALLAVAALLATGALIAGENYVRRGNPLSGGYESDPGGFTLPMLIGLLSILFSFGKGLIFFAPGMLLPVRRAAAALGKSAGQVLAVQRLWLVVAAGLVVVYAPWWAWYGGWWWGPRFFLFASLPASFALALRLRAGAPTPSPSPAAAGEGGDAVGGGGAARGDWSGALTLGVLALSTWVGINGAVFDQRTLDAVCHANGGVHESACWYYPQFSVLWRPLLVREPLTWQNAAFIAYALLVFAYLAAPLAHALAAAALAWARTARPAWWGVDAA
jgi:hypothetical protein